MSRRALATVRSADIAGVRDEWLKLYKPATVVRRLAVLSHLFNVARKEWGMESLSNPVELVRKPAPNNGRTRRIAICAPSAQTECMSDADSERRTNEGELERVVAASESRQLPAIIWIAVETTMRRGEIVGLKWEHIDLDRRVAHLPATKNGSTRDVPLSPRAVNVLGVLQQERRRAAVGTGLVFPIRADAVTRAFERAVTRARKLYLDECEAANLQAAPKFLADLRFHDLRHEATSRLASIFPLHELTKITGHRDPRMLMRYYHPRAEDLTRKFA